MEDLDELLTEVSSAVKRRHHHIDQWVDLALAKPRPTDWVKMTINDAMLRLDSSDHHETLKQHARSELLAIQRDILAGVAEQKGRR